MNCQIIARLRTKILWEGVHMRRIDIVKNALENLCKDVSNEEIEQGFSGYDTNTISEFANISRSNTSKELNLLVKKGEVLKIAGRPVYYFSKKRMEEIYHLVMTGNQVQHVISLKQIKGEDAIESKNFSCRENLDLILEKRPSLSKAIKLGKAAIIYPPNGLHTLILGPSGVGKTFFAEAMYNYAREHRNLKSDGKFIVFNCAEYADNPQLLLSQLFGYTKGAFTGADQEQVGIIDEADGGILLLDEVHRLPPQGQEILFTLIDKGYFRRLGENSTVHQVDLRLICATTEKIESNILITFLRRIPMVIDLPGLSESTVEERFGLIEGFFCGESIVLGMDIEVCREVILGLLFYDPRGNIGQLRSDIQTICAKGFLDYKLQGKSNGKIIVDINLLPDEVYQGILQIKKHRSEIENFSILNELKTFLFNGKHAGGISNPNADISQLYGKITQFYKNYLKQNMDKKDIMENIDIYIRQYMDSLIEKNHIFDFHEEKEKLSKMVSMAVYDISKNAIEMAELRLGRKLDRKTVIAFILHISALLERISSNYISKITNEELKKIENNQPNEYQVACEMKYYMETQFHVIIPKQEIAFFIAFLSAALSEKKEHTSRVGIVVVAHGKSTATSMADVANSLLDTSLCKAIDMDLNDSVEACLEKVTEFVVNTDTGKGVLLLVDMGSLNAFAEVIHQKTNIHVRSIGMVSTAVALEAVRKSLYSDEDLDSIANSLMNHLPYTGKMVSSELRYKKTMSGTGDLIIVTCISGKGVAVKLCELIKNEVALIEEEDFEIKPFDYKGSELTEEERERAVLLVGASDLKIEGVPYISIDEVIMGKGLQKIARILSRKEREEEQVEIPNFVVSKILTEYLTFLNPKKANETVNFSFAAINQNIKFHNKSSIRIRFLIHCCSMIERAILKQPLEYGNAKKVIENNQEKYGIVRKAFEIIEDTFSVGIDDTEVAYVLDLINTD